MMAGSEGIYSNRENRISDIEARVEGVSPGSSPGRLANQSHDFLPGQEKNPDQYSQLALGLATTVTQTITRQQKRKLL